MDTGIIGKLDDWTFFTYKNLFGLFFRKAENAELRKSTRLTFWVPVPKAVEVVS